MTRAKEVRNIALLTVITLLMMMFFGQIPLSVDFSTVPDLTWYSRIAEAAPSLDPNQRQPFAFRLLGPYVIGLLPLPEPVGFRTMTIFLAFCFVFSAYFFFRWVGFSQTVSLGVTVLTVLSRYIFGFTFHNYIVNDFLMLILIMAMFLAMWAGRWVLFGVALTLGAVTREPTMLMVPVALFYVWEHRKGAATWRKALLACVPGVVVIIFVRALVPYSEGRSLTEALATFSGKLYEPRSLFRLLINSFLPLTLIPLVYWRRTLSFFRHRIYLLLFAVLVLGTTLFGSNQERLMIPTFVVFFTLIATILEGVRDQRVTFAVLIIASFLSSFHYNFGTFQLPGAVWTRALTLGSSLIVTVYMIVVRIRSNEDTQPVDIRG